MQKFNYALLALFVGALLVRACRIEPSTLKGDVTALDVAVQFSGQGKISLPATSFGGSGFSFMMDIFPNSATGCLFSGGSGKDYLEARLVDGSVELRIGEQSVKTYKIVNTGRWQNLIFSVDYSDSKPEVKFFLNGLTHNVDNGLTNGLDVSDRSIQVGSCSSDGETLNADIDNFVIFNNAVTQEDAEWYSTQFFPQVHSDNLVFYFAFNDIAPKVGGLTRGHSGAAANSFMKATLLDGAVGVVKKGGSVASVADTTCEHHGSAMNVPKSKLADNFAAYPPYYNASKPGATATARCVEGDKTMFTVQQLWDPQGGISEMTVKTSAFHYWRISAPDLKVEHRTWGGWHVVPRGADLIDYDQTSYKFTDDSVMIQSGKYGFVKITESNGHLDYEMGVNTHHCQLVGAPTRKSWCDHLAIDEPTFDFSNEPVPEMPFGHKSDQPGIGGPPVLACPPPSEQYRPDDLLPPPPPPPPPPPSYPPPPPVEDKPCTELLDESKATAFRDTCKNLYTEGSQMYQHCLDECCISGTCPTPVKDCSSQRLLAASNSDYEIDPKCDTTGCPNQCTDGGYCNVTDTTEKCECDDGRTGPDCSQDAWYPCFRVTAPGENVAVRPMSIKSGGELIMTNDLSHDKVAAYSQEFEMQDTAVIYLAKTAKNTPVAGETKYDYHIVILNNNGNGAGSGDSSYTLKISGAEGATINVDGKTETLSASHPLKFSWMFNTKSIAYITDIPDSVNVDLTITDESPNTQFVIGSQHKGADSGKMEVVKHDTKGTESSTITFDGHSCDNNCADIETCDVCALTAGCGWCAESNQCLGGDASGPVFSNVTCKNWRYTFDSQTTRRVTQEFAWPVNPKMTEVVFAQGTPKDTMPLELKVSVGKPQEIQWDVTYLSSWSAEYKNAWRSQIDTVLSTLQTYPNLAVGIANLDTSNRGFDVVKALSNPRDNYWFKKHIDQSNVANPSAIKLYTAIKGATTNKGNSMQWRTGARKLIVVTADAKFDDSDMDVNGLRETLIQRDIIPVFAATSSHREQYEQLVTQLGFGFVENLASDSGNLRSITVRSIDNAAGHAAAIQTDTNDHINSAAWQEASSSFRMRSLTDRHVARFSVPVTDTTPSGPNAVSRIHMPAFGVATIDDVESDKPSANAVPAHSSGKEGEIQIIELQGRSFRNLLDVHPVITIIPHLGQLFQVANGTATDSIDSNNTEVTDELGRVAYSPSGAGLQETQKDYTQFSFVISDGCVSSTEVAVGIDLIDVNKPPVTSALPPSGNEDKPLVIFLSGTDEDGDKIASEITQGLHGMKEDGSMDNEVYHGKLYQYSSSILNSREIAETDGTEITGPTPVSDGKGRVIFWPKPHSNSHANLDKTPDLMVKPCISYKVVEVETTKALESDARTLPIDIRPVNDAPLTWGDKSADTGVYSFPWTSVGEDFGCYQTGAACTFDEDFGSQYPWDSEYKYLYLGGGDVEKSQLSVKVTTFECPEDAVVQNDLIGDRNIAVGDEMIDNEPNTLSPLIRFRPGPDGNNENSVVEGSDVYCKIGYKLVDDQGLESEKEHVIDISVTPLPDLPRLATSDDKVNAIEKVPKSFNINGVDPENKNFKTLITNCGGKGVLEYCEDSNCLSTGSVDCSNIPSEGVELPAAATQKRQSSGVIQTHTPMIFTSEKINSLSEGTEYNVLDVVFRDDDGGQSEPFQVTINVISINDAPEVVVNNITDKEVSISAPGERAAPSVAVRDTDIGNGILDLTITLKGEDGNGRISIDTSVFENVKSEKEDEIVVRGKLSQVNKALSSFEVTGTKFKSYTIEMTANDNGYFGQCPDFSGEAQFTGKLCPLESKTTMKIEFVDQDLINVAIIAGAGAGVLAIAAAGAVGATQFFNSKAANADYSPWDAFDNDGASVANPLYESGSVGGENRIFDAAPGNGDYKEFGDSYL